MKFLFSRRGAAAVAVLLLILFLFRPVVGEFRSRIAGSIGRALDRRVALDNVRLRLLPRPGFDLEGLVIYDDPAFSAEPMIRAQEVSAAIRFRSLLRGRLEIATLSATEPSINLVRNFDGRWNLSSLLERNAQIPAAPTGKIPSERRPAFPYLEASNARINFKLGQTKKSYALTDADVALWQDSENSWSARMKAAPVRTDFNLTDTGLLQINATWQRAASLRLTPVQLTAQWKNGQLGQVTKLLRGKDSGWRGEVNVTAKLSGTPEALLIDAQTAIDDFRRYDIVGTGNVRLATSCSGKYDAFTGAIDGLLCESPVNGGNARLRGSLAVASQPVYDLSLALDKVPLASLARLLRQSKKGIPGKLAASGLLNAEFRAQREIDTNSPDGWLNRWSGNGSVTNVRLSSNANNARKDEVAFGTVALQLVPAHPARGTLDRAGTKKDDLEPYETHLVVGPAALSLNASAPVSAGGWISAKGYRFFLRGDAELQDLFRLEEFLGLTAVRPAAEGSARLDVNLSGPWQGFIAPLALGTIQLHNVRAEMHGLNTPIAINAAVVSVTPDLVWINKISAATGGTHWSGMITSPRHCASLGCVFHFDLAADQLSSADLGNWLTPRSDKRPWYHILSSAQPPGKSPLLAIQAEGNLRVSRFTLKRLLATQVDTLVDVDRGKITLTDLRGQLLQGTHQGNWTIDLSTRDDVASRDTPAGRLHYRGTGNLHDISLAQVGLLMNDPWIAGTGDASFDLDTSGSTFPDLLAGSDGRLQFVMRNGSLPHIELPGSGGHLPVHRFTGQLRLEKGAWEISDGKLESRDGIYQVSGTASVAAGCDFLLSLGGERAWKLTGTLAKPQVAATAHAENTRAQADAIVESKIKP